MTVTHVVHGERENLIGTTSWIGEEDHIYGIQIYLDTVRIFLSAEQLETIIKEWNEHKDDLAEFAAHKHNSKGEKNE
jgi:hypothetical protein